MRITKAAWVMDDLSPTILLGNDALAPYGANIHYDARSVDFTSLDLKIPFDIEVRATSCTRKVTTTREIVLLPGQQAHIPVEYKPLPNDRSFAFEAKHGAMVNSIINAKTPKVVLVVNQSNGTLRIPKNTHAGTIKENIESGLFCHFLGQGLQGYRSRLDDRSSYRPDSCSFRNSHGTGSRH